MYRDLKDHHSVVYGCGLHASLRTRCVTSDRDEIIIWNYDKKGEYAVELRLERAATILRRELVQAAQSRKYEALVIENGRPAVPDYMLIYRGHSGSALFPLKGEVLERARMQLLKGVADASWF
ncbi:hypothetical protein [Haloechinothrix salitolerans]|uniref:Uncharacterized protein n=1 Tax=Haloechinothrix salitolerans TaxID=926830 RepID=A0ABW2C7I5_9PSEU